MKKWMKITLGVIGIVVLLLVIDLVCIFIINRPLLAIEKDNVYRGLLYDTYICDEYSVPQIKSKGTIFMCSTDKIFDVEEKINYIVENGPMVSSNPFDYVEASKEVYNELLNHPKETFEYSIDKLIKSDGNGGLKSYIEALLCSEINSNFEYDFESAKDYIDQYKVFLTECDCLYNDYDKYALTLIK